MNTFNINIVMQLCFVLEDGPAVTFGCLLSCFSLLCIIIQTNSLETKIGSIIDLDENLAESKEGRMKCVSFVSRKDYIDTDVSRKSTSFIGRKRDV